MKAHNIWPHKMLVHCQLFLLLLIPVFSNVTCPEGCLCIRPEEADCKCGTVLRDVPQLLTPQLEQLKLSGCTFATLSSSQFSRYPQLRRLVLHKNMIRTIQAHTFSGLNQLELLSIQYNPYLTELVTNSISGIHADGRLEIYLSNNNISVIHKNAFSNSRGIRRLDLSENPVYTVRANAFSALYHVDLLRLPRNIRVIEANAFSNLTRVHLLLIDYWMADIDNDGVLASTFSNMSHVDTVAIGHSRLGVIHAHAFGGMHTVHKLHITDSHITRIKRRSLSGLHHLGTLLMADNKIDKIDRGAFSVLHPSTRVNFERNYINCSCKNAWLYAGNDISLVNIIDDDSEGEINRESQQIPANFERDNYCNYPPILDEMSLQAVSLNYTNTCVTYLANSQRERLMATGTGAGNAITCTSILHCFTLVIFSFQYFLPLI